jgi:hypothetical protein
MEALGTYLRALFALAVLLSHGTLAQMDLQVTSIGPFPASPAASSTHADPQ